MASRELRSLSSFQYTLAASRADREGLPSSNGLRSLPPRAPLSIDSFAVSSLFFAKMISARRNEPRKRSELFRVFEFASFEDAIAVMGAAVAEIVRLDHDPRWENIWRSVSVWLTTWGYR